jgi:ubiquitin C-terminal hydrolase
MADRDFVSFTGHYFNFLKDFDGKWVMCSDSSVVECKLGEAMKKSSSAAYMIIYERSS